MKNTITTKTLAVLERERERERESISLLDVEFINSTACNSAKPQNKNYTLLKTSEVYLACSKNSYLNLNKNIKEKIEML